MLLLMQVADGLHELLTAARVKARNWLIEHEVLRLQREHAGDGHTALLPAGKRKRRALPVRRIVEMHELHRFLHALRDLCFRQAEVARAKGDIGLDGLFKQLLLRILKHHADLEPCLLGFCALLLILGVDVDAIDKHAALCRLQQAVELLQKRRLARARMAGDSRERTFFDAERHIVQGLMLKRRLWHVDVIDML